MADQTKLDELLDRLKQLNESQIEELIYRLRVDRSHLSGSGASASQKAIELIRYLEPQADGLRRLRTSLESLLNLDQLDDPASLPDCPYQGLFAFQEKNAEVFFGREAFLNDQQQADGSIRQGLVRAVETKPLVAVVGASGSGKSSLVFAGLVPRLRESGNWLIESIRPEKQPFFRLAIALMRQLEPGLDRVGRIAKANDLAATIQKHGIASIVSEILQEHSGKRLLLVVDQFEELYTQCEAGERDRFIDALLEGLNKAVGLKVVLTLRADFCGQVYAYRPLADALQGADLKLGPMNREELQQAIEQPAQLMQVQFEEGLTEWLLDDVGQEAGNLPLLEFALTELWKMQRQKTLIYQAYSRLGGVARALANHADGVYARLSESDQKRAQRIFVQLVRPGDGTEDTRRVASRAEAGIDNWDLVTHLAGEAARLVVTGRNEETVEIIHEALLREWQLLRKWMEQDRTFRTWQEGLRFARRQWQQSGQDEAALLDGFLLSEAEEWQSKRREDLSSEEQEFIQLSIEVRDRRIQQRLNELQELVEQKDKALQAETVAAEQARNAAKQSEKAARAARVRTLAVAIGAVAIALSGGYAWWLQQQSLQVLRDLALGVDSGSPKLLETLPTFLYEANRDRDRNRAMAYYRKIIIEADKLQNEVDKNPNQFPNGEQDKAAIAQIRNQAEKGLNHTIIQTLIPELKSQIQAGSSKGSFGMKVKDDWTLGAEQYEPGAVRATYEIIIKSTGSDINGNGFLDNDLEAKRIPGALIIEIEKTWRETTDCKCGWYGSNNFYTSDCPGLDSNSLFSLIFSKTTDFLVIDQFSQNGITKSGYSRDAAKSVHCSS
jgi:hypothetical protein